MKINYFVFAIFLSTSTAQEIPHKFSAGNVAVADSMNANFDYLIAQVKALKDADKVNNPVGMIIASTVTPDNNGWMPNTNQTWAVCDGDPNKKSIVTGKGLVGDSIPDLRGVFLRGLDGISSGRSSTGRDVNRAIGNYQDDAFQGHWHDLLTNSNSSGTGDHSNNPYAGWNGLLWHSNYPVGNVIADTIHGAPRISTETRSKNVAVYYYIKVK